MSLYRESNMVFDLQSPSFLVHIPLISLFFPSTTTVFEVSKKSYIVDINCVEVDGAKLCESSKSQWCVMCLNCVDGRTNSCESFLNQYCAMHGNGSKRHIMFT
jgi:hypothetical protein